MQQLEGFQCATTLDLNMGYYTKRISPTSQEMTKIVTNFWKSRYNYLPMVMCAYGDTLQDKAENLLDDIKGVKTYIDDILFLIK